MPTELAYMTMKTNFRAFMEDVIKGDTYNVFREARGVRSLKNNPTSTFNGAYVINWGGTKTIDKKTTSGYLDFIFTVKLQIGFILNKNETDSNTELAAVNDIETIIKKRINSSSWDGTSCRLIRFDEATEFEYINDTYAITDLTFTVIYETAM